VTSGIVADIPVKGIQRIRIIARKLAATLILLMGVVCIKPPLTFDRSIRFNPDKSPNRILPSLLTVDSAVGLIEEIVASPDNF
jgi:hypothetical protein